MGLSFEDDVERDEDCQGGDANRLVIMRRRSDVSESTQNPPLIIAPTQHRVIKARAQVSAKLDAQVSPAEDYEGANGYVASSTRAAPAR